MFYYRAAASLKGNLRWSAQQFRSALWKNASLCKYLRDPENPNSSGFGAALLDGMMGDLFRYIVFVPAIGTNWDIMTFAWETDFCTVKEITCTQCYGDECMTYSIAAGLDAITLSYSNAPNMAGFGWVRSFKTKDGQILHWHDWSYALVAAFTSVSLYETVISQIGANEIKDFWKLYMMHGAGHGGGGYGAPELERHIRRTC